MKTRGCVKGHITKIQDGYIIIEDSGDNKLKIYGKTTNPIGKFAAFYVEKDKNGRKEIVP